MTEVTKKKSNTGKRIISAVMFVLCAVLIVVSICGYVFRGLDSTSKALNEMRSAAVLHAASQGIVDSIANSAKADALKELRARSDFRQLGQNAIDEYIAEAESTARADAEAKYSNTDGADLVALEGKIDVMEQAQTSYNAQLNVEQSAYAEMYTDLTKAVEDWTDFTADLDDDQLKAAMAEKVPALGEPENAAIADSLVRLVRDNSEAEAENEKQQAYDQLVASVSGAVGDWTSLESVAGDDDALWAALVEAEPALAQNEDFRADILAEAKKLIAAALSGEVSEGTEAAEGAEGEEEIAEESSEITVNYKYFTGSETLTGLKATADAAFEDLWGELVAVIPDLAELDNKTMDSVHATIEGVVNSGSADFSTRYSAYAKQDGAAVLSGGEAAKVSIAANAERYLIAAVALLLLTLTYTFWKQLVRKMGVPRTIILLFFIYLLLAARLYNISVPSLLGSVLERVCMYGILVLAMLPGIQCGIGLNMGMTLGCIAGLLATIMSLQFDMTGAGGLIFSCVTGAIIAIPLGWAYSLLLNKMKGNEMTIATYVGFSFVSLMCIGWMLLPFTNIKIIWLLRGRGLRVTHSLLGSFAHLLDNFMAFEVFGISVPTGGLLFFLLFCAIMYLFSKSKLGIAMTAAGSNPRFAEASGINVDRMRTLGTVLSTMIAAVGIVIYSQSFGYAQLYTAPRQLGFLAASAILIGGATVSKAKISHVIIGVFLFEGVLAVGQQMANAVFTGGGMSEVMRIMISNGIILYALTQSGGGNRD